LEFDVASPRRPLVLLAAVLLAALTACAPGGLEVLDDAKPAAPSTAPSPRGAIGEEADGLPLTEAVAQLRVAEESRDGYTRSAFKHWVDEDGDGCNTRNEVLLAEALTAPEQGERCRLTGGQWTSYYDEETVTNPSKLDIDHVVPLAGAWDSK